MRRAILLVALGLLSAPAFAQHILGTAFNGSSVVQLVDLNPTTGAAAFLAGTVTDAASFAGPSAYDATGNRYFFLGTPSGGSLSIYVVTIGAMSFTKQMITGSGFTNILDIEYNPLNTTLYALVSTGSTLQMATINTATGAVTLQGSVLGAGLSYSGHSKLDPTSSGAFPLGRFYFHGSPNNYGVNVSTSTIYRQKAELAATAGMQAGGGGLYVLQFNGADGRVESLDTTDTATWGTATDGPNLTGGTFSASGRETFDLTGNRYYFIGQATTINANALSLFTVDATTRALVGSPVAISGQTNLQGLEFDAGTVPVTLQTFEVD